MGRKSEFSREEKIAAVRLTTEGGRTVLSVANEYGVHENTIMKWKRQYKTNPDLAFSGQNGETPPDETERLKRRIRELENEVEFLKKVSAYFAKHPQ
jgi:transposase